MTRFAALVVCVCSCLVATLSAGPLVPPAGPIASTQKTLSEIEPRIAINSTNTPGDADSIFRIGQAGSYYLTGNMLVGPGEHGIKIAASGVTIDLNGFQIAALGGLTGVIVTNTAVERIVIRNGSIANFGQGGIDANVRVVSVDRISVEACGALGIRAGTQARITDCTVVDCHSSARGIEVDEGSIVDRCIAENNSGTGIFVGPASTVSNSTATGNSNNGFFLNDGGTITHCAAEGNSNSGIFADRGSTVTDCVARGNILDGIVCTLYCVVRGNTCTGNGLGGDGAGIHATENENRIEGNHCIDADRGIDVDLPGNIIIRNTCANNTIDWVIVANNVVGPILDRRVPASAAINGFSASDSTGSTHPNANISH